MSTKNTTKNDKPFYKGSLIVSKIPENLVKTHSKSGEKYKHTYLPLYLVTYDENSQYDFDATIFTYDEKGEKIYLGTLKQADTK